MFPDLIKPIDQQPRKKDGKRSSANVVASKVYLMLHLPFPPTGVLHLNRRALSPEFFLEQYR
jgi:hypothetical protein